MRQVFETHTEEETIDRGSELAARLAPGSIVAIAGDLGSGKTRFIKGICRGLGVREHVSSPTFTIVNEYPALRGTVYHFDFYRISSLREVIDIGFEEYLGGDGISLIEWADRVAEFLPPRRFDVRMDFGRDERTRIISVEERSEEAP